MMSDFSSGVARLLTAWALVACSATAFAQSPAVQAEALARQAAEQQSFPLRLSLLYLAAQGIKAPQRESR